MDIGEVIDGKYQVDRQLGEGGMGTVVAVTHVKLGKRYAIKLVKHSALKIPRMAERFLREARAASQLKSEHVGAVIDFGETPSGQPYMVMELLDGHDLGAASSDTPLPVAQAVEYVLQACEALAEAHSLGMVHRDIKPSNLFVTRRRDGSALVKVLDFGIATAAHGEVSGLTETDSVMGSPHYMSPEQLRSAKHVDARSDIWAIGVTLYELVSGVRPFDGTTFSELAIQIATEDHRPLDAKLGDLAPIIERCLAKQAKERYATIAELAYALAPLTPGGTAAADRVARALGAKERASPLSATLPATAAPEASRTRDTELPKDGTTVHSQAEVERRPRWRVRALLTGLAAAAAVVVVMIANRSGATRRQHALASGALDAAQVADGPATSDVVAVDASIVEESVSWIALEGERFLMGSTQAQIDAARALCTPDCRTEVLERETPASTVELSRFQIERTEVTVQAFLAWLGRGKVTVREGTHVYRDGKLAVVANPEQLVVISQTAVEAAKHRALRPVTRVTFDAARAYCKDAGGDLPTEAQWEYAARGRDARIQPWGEGDARCDGVVFGRAATGSCVTSAGATAGPVDVGSAPQDVTPEGVRDLAGNVSEWTRDGFVQKRECVAPCRDPVQPLATKRPSLVVVRGGSFASDRSSLRGAERGRMDREQLSGTVGFRCVMGDSR